MHEPLQHKERIIGMLTLMGMSLAAWVAGIFFFCLPLPVSSRAMKAAPEELPTFMTDAPTILLVLIITLGVIYFLRKKKYFAEAIAILMGLLIYNTLSVIIEPIFAAAISGLFVYIERKYYSFLTTDIFVLAAVFAGTMPLATLYQTDFLVGLLIVVAIYDVFGVVFTHAIPKVAVAAAQKGMPLLVLAPRFTTKWLAKPTMTNSAAIMGAGDIFVPLLFLTAVSIQWGIGNAIICLIGALAGNLGNFFLVSKTKRGIPAMPLLSLGMILAYIIVKFW